MGIMKGPRRGLGFEVELIMLPHFSCLNTRLQYVAVVVRNRRPIRCFLLVCCLTSRVVPSDCASCFSPRVRHGSCYVLSRFLWRVAKVPVAISSSSCCFRGGSCCFVTVTFAARSCSFLHPLSNPQTTGSESCYAEGSFFATVAPPKVGLHLFSHGLRTNQHAGITCHRACSGRPRAPRQVQT